MKGTYLGEFEELILLTVGVLGEGAYGITVMQEIKNETDRSVNISAVHTSLRRLEDKGFVKSTMGGATSERGGRRKRYFALTESGIRVLNHIRDLRNQMWDRIPAVSIVSLEF